MQEVLTKAGVMAKVNLQVTSNRPEQLNLGFNYDMASYWGHTPWYDYLNPVVVHSNDP